MPHAFLKKDLYPSPTDKDYGEQATCIVQVKISSYIGITRHLPLSLSLWWAVVADRWQWQDSDEQVLLFLVLNALWSFWGSAFNLNFPGVCYSCLPGILTQLKNGKSLSNTYQEVVLTGFLWAGANLHAAQECKLILSFGLGVPKYPIHWLNVPIRLFAWKSSTAGFSTKVTAVKSNGRWPQKSNGGRCP